MIAHDGYGARAQVVGRKLAGVDPIAYYVERTASSVENEVGAGFISLVIGIKTADGHGAARGGENHSITSGIAKTTEIKGAAARLNSRGGAAVFARAIHGHVSSIGCEGLGRCN